MAKITAQITIEFHSDEPVLQDRFDALKEFVENTVDSEIVDSVELLDFQAVVNTSQSEWDVDNDDDK